MDPLGRFRNSCNLFGDIPSQPKPLTLAVPIDMKLGQSPGMSSLLRVPRGQFTFDSEGQEAPGRLYHSRTASVPNNDSGITIGRGFDLGQFTTSEIGKILSKSGFPEEFVNQAKGASKLEGQSARTYLQSNPIRDVTLQEQWQLFNEVRNMMELDVRRISAKPVTVEAYGVTDWYALSRTTQDLIVDLRFRGDYNPTTRERIQPAIVKNDVLELAKVLADENYWRALKVPEERIRARKEFAESQLRSPLSIYFE